jgi:hypothetical protein
MRDPFATPWLIVIALFLLPIVVAGLVGLVAFRRMVPMVYRCRRCDREFLQAPHRPFPAACPHCHATDWSV